MRGRVGFIFASLAVLGVACGGNDAGRRQLDVMAASSLASAFEILESEFEAANPDIDVRVTSGASSNLALQIENGAPADVFASADESTITKVADFLVPDYRVFATNQLQIMVASGNPKNIRSLADLERDDLIVITAQEGVPVRSYTDDVLARAGVVANFRSFEANVGGIVTKITNGAADAGIVYRTDVIAAGSRASGVDIPADQNVVARYPIAVLASSTRRDDANVFIAFLDGLGRVTLRDLGFGSP